MSLAKIEKATVTIKGKEYSFLKPTFVELMRIEDKAITQENVGGDFYNNEMLKLVSRDLKADDLVEFKGEPIILSSGEKLSIPKIGYGEWQKAIGTLKEFSRPDLATMALRATGVQGQITFSGFTYSDVDALAMAFFTLYDATELREVVDKISTFCM
ncbi:MAG: hypothetical protein ACRDDH_14500 [Cetobacterium sp.]|uniref:hypothetical protein n=1 Tax=Cetobacterium sp. TaxID=2071632 RepID=UPI003EE5962D